ncbi:glycosyltransferase [Longimicrobium terrae]|uniref:Glycosyltransferase involved in cell wall biosynthesis n=1 Tax=Longimicrobium terrae TaxID=1639882 RepID=A0A841H4Z4_9BACT|nr:glycosyltransferase involved in cell wall biosynthesis [Longimicrobium terrae]MBB6073100.1 glycosyltransferase involved in cell wall biosynthesis [Longimicrobium terrae]NNC30209.1 glycosyltransferase [Longimicrobium terrae]
MSPLLVPLLWSLPWLLLPVLAAAFIRRRPVLDGWPPAAKADAPLVSVIVPARNEAHNIGDCVRALRSSTYPRLEILVVDDGSEDGTGERARAAAEGDPRVRVIDGEPLPAGWFGKPWACEQGVRLARGERIAFCDADMRAGPELVGRTVAALAQRDAALLSAIPRQVLGGFWERVVMAQVGMLFLMRYPDPERVNRSPHTRDKIALGGYILVRRDAYEAAGGHHAVRHEVSEDMAIAQRFHALGHAPLLVHAEPHLRVRMYRSLAEIVEGWGKNLARSSGRTAPGPLALLVPWLILSGLFFFWLLPSLVLVRGALGMAGWPWVPAAVVAQAVSVGFWAGMYRRDGHNPLYAALAPLGALVMCGILLASLLRRGTVTWKGRRYAAAAMEAGAG